MPNIFDDWNLYLKIKQLIPTYLHPAFLHTQNVVTIYQLRAAINDLFAGHNFTYDEMEEARRIYYQQFFKPDYSVKPQTEYL